MEDIAEILRYHETSPNAQRAADTSTLDAEENPDHSTYPTVIPPPSDHSGVEGTHQVSFEQSLNSSYRLLRKKKVFLLISCVASVYYLSLQGDNASVALDTIATKHSTLSVWDVNSPPISLEENQTIESLLGGIEQVKERLVETAGQTLYVAQDKRATSVTEPAAEIQHFKDDKVPGATSTFTYTLHAADSLICRKSVVNFVINATDAKDECEGLKKAFDKTCSNDNTGEEGHRTLKRSRRFSEKAQYINRIRLFLYYNSKAFFRMANSILGRERPFFFAEDEITDAYDDAVCLVTQDMDSLLHQDLQRQWRRQRTLEELKDSEYMGIISNTTIVAKPKPLLDIPTANQHISDKVSAEMLLLHQGEDSLQKVANQSLSKQTSDARDDAAKSSKAVSDANAAVNILLNDPTSIEARTCCASILNVYHENCSKDDEEEMSDSRLFFVVFVMALCGMVKSLIRHFKILWLPEAAGCIIVGVISGYAIMFAPHHDLSFDGNWFLRILVPPIIFEAALSIDKRSFQRHIVPILLYAVIGTLMSTALTAYIVHKGTSLLAHFCAPIPYVEALTFGALISSIDPIAVLSVLSNMGMSDTDTIYVVIFGESLLNDGVAIVLFNTLIHFMDETLIIDKEAVTAAAVHFLIVAFGSLLIGIASGYLATAYYWLFHGCQTPLVEVLMFCCWALLPYYVCDGIGWSGIVAAVAVGFVMDMHVIGQKQVVSNTEDSDDQFSKINGTIKPSRPAIFSPEGLLSLEARQHIGFVTQIISTTMETAIFAYLGLFLFSHRYHWNFFHTVIAISACCISRGILILSLSYAANFITRFQQSRVSCQSQGTAKGDQQAGVIIDKRMQIVLWFAGLRGAMSFALVEHVPLYDTVTGEGTRLKPEMKAMTSACIMFTVFILGGYTYYMMESLGINPAQRRRTDSEMAPLNAIGKVPDSGDEMSADSPSHSRPQLNSRRAFRRKAATRDQSSIDIETEHQ